MRNRQSIRIGALILTLVLGTIAFSPGGAAGNQPGDVAKQGWLTFLEVLAGDQTKFQLAVRQLEQAAATVPTDAHNLFTLGRAYFYDAIAHNNLSSAEKAERTFARILELNPKHDVHRQTIVQLRRARELHALAGGHYLLRLSDGSDVEVGRNFSRDFRSRFG